MANILLTNKCNRSCPYCFAKREMEESSEEDILSWENLIYIADFLKRSGQNRVSLLGGEPTIHPQFVDFVLYLLERGFDVTVFTNGILSPTRLAECREYLTKVRLDRLSFVCNLNDPVQTPAPPNESLRLQEFLSEMGPWASPGFNIYRLDFKLEFLFDHINRYGMKRNIRLGVAHPVPGKESGYIKPSGMRKVIRRLYAYRPLFDANRVSPGLDCGFPICKFTDRELGWLGRFPNPSHFSCGPAFDITPDMSVYHCFPLSNYKRRSLFEFDSMDQLFEHFAQLRQEVKSEIPGIFDECDACRYQESGVCSGGGLCQVLNRMVGEAPVRIAEVEHELAKSRMPV